MKIALLGDADHRDGPLRTLLKGSEHRVRWTALEDSAAADFRGCGLVLLDASNDDPAAQERLVSAAHAIRARAPGVTVLVVSAFESGKVRQGRGRERQGNCQLAACGDGVWRVRCRLHELAWAETEALIREALERETNEPVVFEYRG
jgi:hypothetical protein